jgi:hypothetical protein
MGPCWNIYKQPINSVFCMRLYNLHMLPVLFLPKGTVEQSNILRNSQDGIYIYVYNTYIYIKYINIQKVQKVVRSLHWIYLSV